MLEKELGRGGGGGVEVLQGEPQGGAQAPPCPGVLGVPGRDSPAPPRRYALPGMEKEEEEEKEDEEETPRGQGAAGAGLGPVVGGASRAGRFYTVPAAQRLPPGAMRGGGLLCGIALSLLLPPPRPCGAPPALHERLREPPGSGGAGAGSGAPRDPPAAGAEPQPEVVEPRWAAPGSPGGQKVGRARRRISVLFPTSASFAGRGDGTMPRSARRLAMLRFVLSWAL